MSVAVRVIPCLDVDAGRVVKGVRFADLRDAGDPVELAERYEEQGADELVFLDVTASAADRPILLDVVARTASTVFVPLTVGGGVRSVADADALLRAGADKVSVNTAAVARPALIRELADRFGSQCVVLSLDAARGVSGSFGGSSSGGSSSGGSSFSGSSSGSSSFEVTTHGGGRRTGADAIAWTERAVELGAGEVLLNSVDTDGTRGGFDLSLISAVRDRVRVPLIASGGAGALPDFVAAVRAGADAVLAASVFHFGELAVADVKAALGEAGFPVRL